MMRVHRVEVRRLLACCTAGILICSFAARSYAGSYTGTFQGTFVNPALSGRWLDVTNHYQFTDNSTSAIYSGVGTNSLQWGDGNFPVPHSLVTFTGYSITDAPGDTEIALGEFSYTNGSSLLSTLIYGAELDIQLIGDPSVETLKIKMEALSTTNRGVASYDADFLSFDKLPNTFHVYEGETATAVLYGKIVGDPTLDPTRIGNVHGAGFLGTGPVPEPTSLTLIAVGTLCVAFGARRRANRRSPN